MRAYNITERVFLQLSQIVYHPTFVFGITLVVIAFCVSLFMNSREIRSSSDLVTHLRSQVAQKQQEYNKTKEQASQAQTPLNQESIIRNELLLQKPGEYIVQMPDLPEPITTRSVIQKQLSPWEEWQKILDL